MKRLTLSGGVRLDFQNESVDAYHYGPGPWLPNRNIDYPEIKNVPNWKDVQPAHQRGATTCSATARRPSRAA